MLKKLGYQSTDKDTLVMPRERYWNIPCWVLERNASTTSSLCRGRDSISVTSGTAAVCQSSSWLNAIATESHSVNASCVDTIYTVFHKQEPTILVCRKQTTIEWHDRSWTILNGKLTMSIKLLSAKRTAEDRTIWNALACKPST